MKEKKTLGLLRLAGLAAMVAGLTVAVAILDRLFCRGKRGETAAHGE